MKIKRFRKEQLRLKVRDIGLGIPFRIPKGVDDVDALGSNTILMKVRWSPNVEVKTDPGWRSTLQWQMDRYACVNIKSGLMYLVDGNCEPEIYLNAEVRL